MDNMLVLKIITASMHNVELCAATYHKLDDAGLLEGILQIIIYRLLIPALECSEVFTGVQAMSMWNTFPYFRDSLCLCHQRLMSTSPSPITSR